MVLAARLDDKLYGELPEVTLRNGTPVSSGLESLFDVAGVVQIVDLFGEVTVGFSADVTNLRLSYEGSLNAPSLDVASLAMRSMISFSGLFGTPLEASPRYTRGMSVTGFYLGGLGSLRLDSSGANVGEIRWMIKWIRVDPAASVVAVYP